MTKATLGLLAASLLAGCSMTPLSSNAPVPKDQAEKIVQEHIERSTGNKHDSVVCDGPLEARVGATQRCIDSNAGDKAGVTLTVTNVEGNKIDFRYQIDSHLFP